MAQRSTKMTNFVSRIQSRGGAETTIAGAGTIYVKHSGLQHGGLIVDNGGFAGANTELNTTSVNSSAIYANQAALHCKFQMVELRY